jgi:hypothetical protein
MEQTAVRWRTLRGGEKSAQSTRPNTQRDPKKAARKPGGKKAEGDSGWHVSVCYTDAARKTPHLRAYRSGTARMLLHIVTVGELPTRYGIGG